MTSTPTSPSPRSRTTQRRRRRRRRRLVPVVVALSVLVALIGCLAGGAALLWHETVGKNLTVIPDSLAFPDEAGRPAPSPDGSQNFLLLGSDSRASADEHDLDGAGNQRSDVTMVVHVPADRSGVQVVSLMRDLWVPIPGHRDAKLNAALAWGGTALTIQTVENLLHTRIDHVATIDFEGLSSMTTALGGVWVENATPFTRSSDTVDGGSHFYPAGAIKVEGATALEFVRERKAFATGDYQRVKNQQQLLKGMLDRVISRDVLSDPSALTRFAGETSKNLSVDSGFTLPTMASLAYGLRGVDANDFTFFTAPTLGTGSSPDGQSIVKVDPEGFAALDKALKDDTVPAFATELAKAK